MFIKLKGENMLTKKQILLLVCLTLPFFVATYLDIAVAQFIWDLPKWFKNYFKYVTILGESQWYLILAVAVFALNFHRSHSEKSKKLVNASIFLFAGVAVSGVIAVVAKVIFGKARPPLFFSDDIYGFFGFKTGHEYHSFPSGHMTTITAVAFVLSSVFPKYTKLWVFTAAMVGISRLMLNAHYLSDVLGGALLGFWVCYGLKRFLKNLSSGYLLGETSL